jgi:integrase
VTPEQVEDLLQVARDERLEALYALSVHLGLRQEESLGLRWDDVDLDRGTLQVRRTLSTAKGGPRFTEPKTARSRRRIKLTAEAVGALRRHRVGQNKERLKAGDLWQDDDLVFCSLVGTPLNHNNVSNRPFKPLLKRAGLPASTRFHDLRHTCATLLLSRNVNPKKVQELLGHSSITTTLDTYSHVLPNMQDEVATEMKGALA